jgi:hypothetical protein
MDDVLLHTAQHTSQITLKTVKEMKDIRQKAKRLLQTDVPLAE